MDQIEPPRLGFLLTDAARLMRRRFEQECRDIPMTSAQLQIVGRLKHNQGLSQAALAALLDIEPMTLSRHIDRMEAAGLVERRPDPNDRRARQLYVTEHGLGLLDPMRCRAEQIYAEAQQGLSEEQRAALIAMLQAVIANLSAADSVAEPQPERRQAGARA
jgi:MarR family transcriptional regulator, transcriptional regulator for hemolysin